MNSPESRWENRNVLPPVVTIKRENSLKKAPYMGIILFDTDHPFPFDRSQSPYLLYLRVNVPSSSSAAEAAVESGFSIDRILAPYRRPSPEGEISHSCTVQTFYSSEPIATGGNFSDTKRNKFDVESFIKTNGLTVWYSGHWMDDGVSS